MNNLMPFMISVDERKNERDKTLPQIIKAGLQPEIVYPIMMPSPASNTEQVMRGLRAAVWRKQDALLFEDDIDIKPYSFTNWLEIVRAQHKPVTLCMLRRDSVHPSVLALAQKTQPVKPLLYEVQQLNKWYGSQCLYIPYLLAHKLVNYGIPDNHDNGFDVMFRNRLIEWDMKLLHCASDPVQHRAPVSVVNRQRKPGRSVTFGLSVSWQ